MTPTSKVEQLARLYCEEIGEDPDERYMIDRHPWPGGPVYRPRWKNHIDKAAAALEPIAMEAALRQLRSGQ